MIFRRPPPRCWPIPWMRKGRFLPSSSSEPSYRYAAVCVCVCVCAMCVCTNGVCAQCVRAVASSTPTQMYSPCQLILSICFFFLPTSSSLPLLLPSLLLPPSFIFLLPSSFIPHSSILLPSFFLFRRSEGQYRCHGASVRRRLAMSPYLPPSQTSTGRLLVIG